MSTLLRSRLLLTMQCDYSIGRPPMQNSRRILLEPGYRPVIAAWLIALVVAAVLAFAAGLVQLRTLQRTNAIADSDRQLDHLSRLLVSQYHQSQADFERDVLHGHALDGQPHQQTFASDDAGDGSLFRFDATRPDRSPADSPWQPMVLRTSVDGRLIDPQFAAWTLRLKFVDDRLAGAWAFSPQRAEFRRAIAGVAGVQRAIQATTGIAAGVALVCLIAAGSVGARWRRQVASAGLAAVPLIWVALSLQPWHFGLLYQPQVLVACMLAIAALAAAALVPAQRRQSCDRPRCRCGYDLTGNISGVCPECGQPTPQGRIDRWAEKAAAIQSTVAAHQPFSGPYLMSPSLTEAKSADIRSGLHRYRSALATAKFACYRYCMSDARLGPDEQGAGPDISSFAHGEELFADDEPSDADRELAERLEYEIRARESELDSVRVRRVLTERRSLLRMRTYFIVLAVTAGVAAGQLGIWCYGRLARGEFDRFVAGYIAAIAGMLIAAWFCIGRIRQYNRELARSVQTEPAVAPDFSTLSDGSQRLDTAAQNLAKLYDRGQ